MTVLAADRKAVFQSNDLVSLRVAASTTIYNGALVCVNSSGYAIPAANTSGNIFAGVAVAQADNSAGSAGDIKVTCQARGIVNAVASGLGQSDVGAELFITDDQTVQTTAAHVRCGRLAYFDSATNAPVDLNPTEDKDAGSQYFCISTTFAGAVGHVSVSAMTDFEMPRAYKVIAGYALAGTAPGGAYVCTIALTDGVTSFDITITGAAVVGETETPSANMLAATDTDITLIDDNASGATADVNVLYVCQYV